jgi:uncharacterized heparinase superfamily protein
LLGKLIRLYHTLKYLRIKQIVWRFFSFFPRFIFFDSSSPNTISIQFSVLFKNGITKDYKQFTFLNETYSLAEYGWDSKRLSKLWRYNLHYFDFLLQDPADLEITEKQKSVVAKWISENPFGKGTGWEPYPTSLRIINWIKWHCYTNSLTESAKSSLWNQIRWLSARPEYHLLGNHLFVNAKALLFGCALFGLDEKSRIYQKALNILISELDEQFLQDGAHFELSPMYHSLAMEDLLDLYQLSSSLPSSFPKEKILEKYKLGMNWLSNMKYDNQEFAHFNDCANGIALKYNELKEYAKKIEVEFQFEPSADFNHFTESGFVVLKNNHIHLIADIGKVGPDYLPGHAHADTLSFELAVEGQRLIVNSGTSEYGLSKERLRQRSTAAHSTVEVNGQSSSEVWSGFRVARRASVSDVEKKTDKNFVDFSAEHDGYKRLNKKCIHRRYWNVSKGQIVIKDVVTGDGNNVVLRYYLHPDVQVFQNRNETVLKASSGLQVNFLLSHQYKVESTTYHDKFGISRKNTCLLIKGNTPFTNSVTLSWNN